MLILTGRADEAAQLHGLEEGYNIGDASAEKILDVPEDIPVEAGWPQEETLIALGTNFINNGSARVVEISGIKFCEGLLETTIRVRMTMFFNL